MNTQIKERRRQRRHGRQVNTTCITFTDKNTGNSIIQGDTWQCGRTDAIVIILQKSGHTVDTVILETKDNDHIQLTLDIDYFQRYWKRRNDVPNVSVRFEKSDITNFYIDNFYQW